MISSFPHRSEVCPCFNCCPSTAFAVRSEAQRSFPFAAPSPRGQQALGALRSVLRDAAQIPSTSILLGISRDLIKAPNHLPAPLWLMENDELFPGMIQAEDSNLPPTLPSPPLMTAAPWWVDSYFRGPSEGSKVSWDESGLAEGSSAKSVLLKWAGC